MSIVYRLNNSFNNGLEVVKTSEKKRIIDLLIKKQTSLLHNQYVNYRYKKGYSSHELLIKKVKSLLNNTIKDIFVFHIMKDEEVYLVSINVSKWDEDHFGFKMAKLDIVSFPSNSVGAKETLENLIDVAVNFIKLNGVKFVSSRLNGDLINAIHVLEDVGFRYYDCVIWPIMKVQVIENKNSVRFYKKEDIPEILEIAKSSQYSRGHYYCDALFDKDLVDAMYIKWVESAIVNKNQITVIEKDGKVVGFFIFKLDSELEKDTGFKYARLNLLAISKNVRGQGFGKELFRETLVLATSLGVDYIDSGYSTKNHISANLHSKNNFQSVYEEVTMHLWL